jgi:hypothetical protein
MKIKTEVEMTPEEAKELMMPSGKQLDLGSNLYQQWLETVTESAFNLMNPSYLKQEKSDDGQE